jgi:hypothetical protein
MDGRKQQGNLFPPSRARDKKISNVWHHIYSHNNKRQSSTAISRICSDVPRMRICEDEYEMYPNEMLVEIINGFRNKHKGRHERALEDFYVSEDVPKRH